MKKSKPFIITEEEKQELRESAIAKELYRLSRMLRNKTKIILYYRLISICLLLALCSFIYLNRNNETKIPKKIQAPSEAKVNHPVSTPAKSLKKTVKKPIYYTVYFQNEKEHALAQFKNPDKAKRFCKILKQMDLPNTQIMQDSIMHNRNELQANDYPYRYAVQLGAYESDVLYPFRENLIWIVNQADQNLNRYRIAPFNGFSKTRIFTDKINLKEFYILPYRNQ